MKFLPPWLRRLLIRAAAAGMIASPVMPASAVNLFHTQLGMINQNPQHNRPAPPQPGPPQKNTEFAMHNAEMAESLNLSLEQLRYRLFGDDLSPNGKSGPEQTDVPPLLSLAERTHFELDRANAQISAIHDRL